jgi:hypothetical protein
MNSLKHGFMAESNVTDGINIEDWVINIDENSKLTFSMWDFGKFLF